jgi:hypothetical protein
MRHLILFALFGLAACDIAPKTPRPDSEVGIERAFFAAYPVRLMGAAVEACSAPGQTLVRPDRDTVICESLPPPQTAAGLILTYDGTIEDLPQMIISFAVAAAEGGYVVTAENYLRIPQRSGAARQVRLRDEPLAREMRRVLESAGGAALGYNALAT